ncbi:hypothetical protein F0562_032946 [Nyssa sinensis]|uniref:Uncharacterized protein n=1 Tax=Nyssa sinensis TaxID=561372 RepID=A0A5J5AU37_9ASTE|nr:hypothetical protein F0562_032946 [Nyssa sinensis]
MAISGDLMVSATLGSHPTNLLRSFSPPSKVDFGGFINGGSSVSEVVPKWSPIVLDGSSTRCHSKRPVGITGEYKLSTSSISQEAESFLLNAVNMSFFERLNLAWKIVFPSTTSRRNSNANIAKQRLKMILFSDRCAVSDEAKQKIVSNVVSVLSDFVEIESQDKVQLSVSTDPDLGTIYSVTVPVRRVKQEYLDENEIGAITSIEYKDTGETSGSVDVRASNLSAKSGSTHKVRVFWIKSLLSCFPIQLENPIRDAISRIRFAPQSNNLLISSWDSRLRLYDVDSSTLRLEAPAEAALLDCCFQNEWVAFSAGSDCSVRRYDLHSGIHDTIGNHEDLVTCVEYSNETCQVISAGWDRKIVSWDTRSTNAPGCLDTLGAEVDSMSLSGHNLIVAVGASVKMYDLRNFNKSIDVNESFLDVRIRCVCPILNSEGFVVGSIDGRVALKYLHPSNSKDEGYVFRCHPKSKEGKHHLVAVNDIAFNPSICGAFVTGNNEGYVMIWDARSKKRMFEFPRYPNSVASLSYNCGGHLLAVASSYTYQEANEIEEPPQIFIHEIDDRCTGSASAGRQDFAMHCWVVYISKTAIRRNPEPANLSKCEETL